MRMSISAFAAGLLFFLATGDPEDDFGYQAIEFIGDDLAVVSYHARDGLHVARIGIGWFYGK